MSTDKLPTRVMLESEVLVDVRWLLRVLEEFALDANPYAVNEFIVFTGSPLSRDGLVTIAREFSARLDRAIKAAP
jgi:hypothetical protein